MSRWGKAAEEESAAHVGQQVIRYVRCPQCRAACAVGWTVRSLDSEGHIERVDIDDSVLREHPCRPPVPWPSSYSTPALRRIRRAAGGWQGRALGRLQRAIVEDIDAELRARGEPADMPSVLTVDPARAAERLRAAAGEQLP